jgi:hypothetical protein
MPGKDDEQSSFEQQEQQRHQAAIDALQFFVSKYSPATINDAHTFYTTAEISQEEGLSN